MSIAHGISVHHAGDIHVESREGRGEAFYSHPEFQNPGKGNRKGQEI